MLINWHVHTHHSVFDSILTPEELVETEKAFGHDTICISNHGTMTGVWDVYKLAKQNNMKLIIANEMYICENINIKTSDYWHIMFVAKNNVGYQNLLKLTSLSHSPDHFYKKPRIDWNDLLVAFNNGDLAGLICTTACLGGVMRRDDFRHCWLWLSELFGDDLYHEMHCFDTEEQSVYDMNTVRYLIEEGYGSQIIPAVDAHYRTKDDAQVHRIWKGIKPDSDYFPTDDLHLYSKEELKCKLFKKAWPAYLVNAWIDNLQKLADKCNVTLEDERRNYPVYPTNDAIEDIKIICRQSWKEKHIGNNPEYLQRFLYELEVLDKVGFLNYFLIMYDVISNARLKEIPVGVGRGSVAGSLVAYLMGITEIDPIKHNIIFERFAHDQRISAPDIDTDVSQKRRNEIISYIEDKYGIVNQVRTCNYLDTKGALRRAGEALLMEPKVVDEIVKEIGEQNLEDIIGHKPLVELAKRFKGLITHYGVHASAVVAFPSEVHEWCALERQMDSKTKEARHVCCYEFTDLENLGLLKLDILGLRNLDVIYDCCSAVNIKVTDIPIYDEKTFQMLQKGDTFGLFQIESEGMTQLVKDIQPQKFEDMVPLVALYRPGPLNSGMVRAFLKNKSQGYEPDTSHLMGCIEKEILSDTYGQIVYQEQVMEIFTHYFGYSLAEADNVRRAIGKKKQEVMDEIISDAKKRCLEWPESDVKNVLDKVIEFAQYGFNKAHSVAYSYTSYLTAYLKANFPLEYYCALLNSVLHNRKKTIHYVNCIKKSGVQVLAPKLSICKLEWSINDGRLVAPPSCIKGAGSCDDIVFEADISKFVLSNRSIQPSKLLLLAQAGCFENPTNVSIQFAEAFKTYFSKITECQEKLIHWATQPESKRRDKALRDWQEKRDNYLNAYKELINSTPPDIDEVSLQVELLGFSDKEVLDLYDLESVQQADVVGGIVLDTKSGKTRAGKPMTKVTLRTYDGIINLGLYNGEKVDKNEVYLFSMSNKGFVRSLCKARRKQ